MENTFSYEATLERARAMAKAKAAGQEVPKLTPARRGGRPRSNFDVDVAIRRAQKHDRTEKLLDESLETE